MTETPRDPSIAIIGAGFAGLCMAIQLKKAGIHDFVIFESAAEVGGTWRDNTYPGCACDVPSHLYSFSFEPHAAWTKEYSGQAEILEYIRGCVDKYGLRPHLRLATEVARTTFDEAHGRWTLETAAGERHAFKIVVAAVGGLRVPSTPRFPGAERFEGPAFHSARWEHGFDPRGKRVAVIGTGASAIQAVPRLAAEVSALHLYQRTPPWVLPRRERAYSAAEQERFASRPALARLYRYALYWRMESAALGFVRYPWILRLGERLGRWHIRRGVADPALAERLTPRFAIGCKRILFSNDYYPAIARDHVELVTDPIVSITERGIVAADGREREVDAIVYCTGFAPRDYLAPMEVRGLGGVELGERWRSGAEAYLGISVADFPNLFVLVGPNTGLGHNSVIFMIEAQVHYALAGIQAIRDEGLRYLDVLPEVQRGFNQGLQARMGRTVWSSGCQSWYLDEAGHNNTLWPGTTWEYWLRTRRLRRGDYRVARYDGQGE
ncbi:MAG: NAD(P)/FAD-dependent oxidoreductase [Nannocystaceae bacterium]